MAIEVFTGYTEVDPNTRIAVTASRVTWTLITLDEDAYVYIDKGAGYFAGNFIINFTYRATGGSCVSNVSPMAFALANLIDDWYGIRATNGDLLGMLCGQSATGLPLIYITEFDSGTQYFPSGDYTYILTANTDYYLKVVRDETVGTYGTLYLYIYSDVSRTTLLFTQTLTLHTAKDDFRYLYACLAGDANSATLTHSGYTEALEIVSNVSSSAVTTQLCTAISGTTATGHGTITNLGSSAVTQHGHCWSTAINPTTADSKTTNGAGSLGAFTSAITGLTPSLIYYVRAYATNTQGTSYGGNISFRAGLPYTQMKAGNLGIKGTTTRYVGDDGVEYYLQGTPV